MNGLNRYSNILRKICKQQRKEKFELKFRFYLVAEACVEVEVDVTDFLASVVSELVRSNLADAFRDGGGIGEVTRSEESEIDDF